MFQWITRCVPGLSILALLSISFAAFVDLDYFLPFQYLVRDYGRPLGEHASDGRPNALSLAQKTFIALSLFVHLNALYFAIRLCFALLKVLKESKKALQRRQQPSTKMSGVEDDMETELTEGVSMNTLEANQLGTETSSLIGTQEIIHGIILPSYKEDFDTLRTTLHVLASHPRAASQYEVIPP